MPNHDKVVNRELAVLESWKWQDYLVVLWVILILFWGASGRDGLKDLDVCPQHHNRAHKGPRFAALFCWVYVLQGEFGFNDSLGESTLDHFY